MQLKEERSPSNVGSDDHKSRLAAIRTRLDALQAQGVDMTAVQKSLSSIEKVANDAKPETLKAALERMDALLSELEERYRWSRREDVGGPAKAASGHGKAKAARGSAAEQRGDEVRRYASLISLAKSLGADVAGVEPHIRSLATSMRDGNEGAANKERSILSAWTERSLRPLITGRTDILVGEVRMLETAMGELGLGIEAGAPVGRMEGALESASGAPLEAASGTIKVIEDVKRSMMALMRSHDQTLRKAIEDGLASIRSSLTDMTEVSADSLFPMIRSIEGKVGQADLAEAFLAVREAKKLVSTLKMKEGQTRFHRMLSSLDDVLSKVRNGAAPDDPIYADLSAQREDLLSLSSSDPLGALDRLGPLIGEAARKLTEMEEQHIRALQGAISELRDRARLMEDGVDVAPLMTVLDKANETVVSGDLEGSAALIEKAREMCKRLSEKRELDVAKARIDGMTRALAELGGLGFDTSNASPFLRAAAERLAEKDLRGFEAEMLHADEHMAVISDLKSRQDLASDLSSMSGELADLRKSGEQDEGLEAKVQEGTALFDKGDMAAASALRDDIERGLGRKKLARTLSASFGSFKDLIARAGRSNLDTGSYQEVPAEAERLVLDGDLKAAVDIMERANARLKAEIVSSTFNELQNDVRSIVGECSDLSVDPGDTGGITAKAKALIDDGKDEEGLELLSNLKHGLSKRLQISRTESNLLRLSDLIRTARNYAIQTAEHKAAYTKANALFQAGETDAALKELEPALSALSSLIERTKLLRERLIEMRGNLIGKQGRIGRLKASGIDVKDLPEKVIEVRGAIESSDIDAAEEGMRVLDAEIDALSTGLIPRPPPPAPRRGTERPEQKEKALPEAETQVKAPEARPRPASGADEREELQRTIDLIKVEWVRKVKSGTPTEEAAKEIEAIQLLVARKEFHQAAILARLCYDNLRGK